MTFQIFVGGQRVNSDRITSTPAWAGEQAGASRKRTCEDPSEPSAGCKRQQGAQDAAHVLQQVTNHAGVAK